MQRAIADLTVFDYCVYLHVDYGRILKTLRCPGSATAMARKKAAKKTAEKKKKKSGGSTNTGARRK